MLKKLKSLRNEKGISQQQLADIVGVTQQSINKYENHKIEPDIFTLIAIADYFDVSIDYLVGRFDSDDLSAFVIKDAEKSLILKYRKLKAEEKICIDTLVDTYFKCKK